MNLLSLMNLLSSFFTSVRILEVFREIAIALIGFEASLVRAIVWPIVGVC